MKIKQIYRFNANDMGPARLSRRPRQPGLSETVLGMVCVISVLALLGLLYNFS